MTTKLTQAQLEAIRERAEKATPGPWQYSEQYGYLAPVIPQRSVAVICNEINRGYDADFIANARQDVPALLAEIERLRNGIDKALYDFANEDYTDPDVVEKVVDGLRDLYNGGGDRN